jgi:UDPglucose 6-dehydrogenase
MINVIGIVGQGFVGSAVREGMKKHFKIETFDILPEKSTTKSLEELYRKTDMIFVCLPTPMKKTGECDTKIVDSVFSQLNEMGTGKIVVLKSTVPPGTCRRFQEEYRNIELIFNPEFLTEANAVMDFINQDRIVLGGNNVLSLSETADMFRKAFPSIPIIQTSSDVAEMVKYVTNCFLSVKVAFANQLFDLCSAVNINYDDVADIAKLDTRIGTSHWKVPGPDGDRGYGGHCFPKDMNAFLYFSSQVGSDFSLIESAIRYNDIIRTDRNWELMVGRAVSED